MTKAPDFEGAFFDDDLPAGDVQAMARRQLSASAIVGLAFIAVLTLIAIDSGLTSRGERASHAHATRNPAA
jgi:hypothetical protein